MPEFAFLWNMAVKGTLVLGVAWLVAAVLRRNSAAARHLVWTAAMAGLVALPALSVALPAWRVPAPALRGTGLLFEITSQAAVSAAPAPAQDLPAAARQRVEVASPVDWRLWAARLWILGSAVLLLQMLAAHAAAWFTRRRARPISRIQGIPILEVPAGRVPMTVGMWRAAILLPADAGQWSEDRRQAVVRHEVAHVLRGDLAAQFLARVALVLYWWNPLAWMGWREFVNERERAADDLVLSSGTRPSEYAAHLLEVARGLRPAPSLVSAAVAMARPSQLESRLLAILDADRNRRGASARAAVAASLFALLLVAPFAAVRAQDPTLPPEVDATIRAAAAQKNHEILDRAASAYRNLRKYDVAEKLLQSSLAIRGEASGQKSAAYAAGLVKLGDLAMDRGKVADAEAFYSQAVAVGDSAEIVPALLQLGMRAYGRADDSAAADLFQRALTLDPRGPKAGQACTWLANVKSRKPEMAAEAETLYLQAMSLKDPNSLDYAMTLDFYAFFLAQQKRDSEAETTRTRAREIRRESASALATQLAVQSGAARVGGGVSAPALLLKVEPAYTPEARAAKFQGTVLLYVEIDTDGVAKDVRVTRSLGLGLDEKAVEAIQQWKFRPGTDRNGNPIRVAATIEVNFRLQ